MEAVVTEGTSMSISEQLKEYGGAAGKTGSAETGDSEVVHAWFAGYFPCREPRYSIAVFVENGKSGGKVAAPIFAQIAVRIIKEGL
jgi:peptidoglycan glycosyltransferase/penicillin-binding protein 2